MWTTERLTLDDPRDFLDWRIGSGRTVEIADIVVMSERRQGKGRALVEKLKAVLLARGDPYNHCSLIYAITRMSNHIAHQFYEAQGFRIVARLHQFYRDGGGAENAIMYGLDL